MIIHVLSRLDTRLRARSTM